MSLETKEIDVEALLAKAKKPAADAMVLHPFYKGKMETSTKCAVRDFNDFAIWYTPGVAAPCRDIEKNPERVYDHTNKWNTVAVISDGTRVLGLGDIGPKAGLPVMEGKALLYQISWVAWMPSPSCWIPRIPTRSSKPSSCCSPHSAASIWKTSPNQNASASWIPCGRKPRSRSGMTTSKEQQQSPWRP